MCIIPFCIDDERSSGDEILHPFEPDLFESSHKPNDDESSDIYHPFEPDMFEYIHKPDDDQSSGDEILHAFKLGSLDDSDDEKTVHDSKAGEVDGSSDFDNSFSSNDNMLT